MTRIILAGIAVLFWLMWRDDHRHLRALIVGVQTTKQQAEEELCYWQRYGLFANMKKEWWWN